MGPASAPGSVMDKVAAPWRTATLGQSTSAGGPAGLLPPGGGFDDFPNPNHPPSLSVIDSSATAGDIAERAHATSATRAARRADVITHSSPKLERAPLRVVVMRRWPRQGRYPAPLSRANSKWSCHRPLMQRYSRA